MNQHRLARVQLVNWGTFNGYWQFGVPRRGLLLTGGSGAGKSSILDAMAAVLVRPNRLRFNAAAQGTDTGDRERNLVTYVRGAHKRETDSETGEIGTAFLRKGATWSGIALTFADDKNHLTTLIRLFHLRQGAVDAADLKTMFIVAPESVDLLSLAPYVADGVEVRRVKATFAHWDVYGADAYTGFANKFRRVLGLGSEQAQILLHKTQSAKNLTNLDTLFRDFMLDEPNTFELSRQAVTQFDELSQAHATVVDARNQVEKLVPLRELADRWRRTGDELNRLAEQERYLQTWLQQAELATNEQELAKQQTILGRFTAEVEQAQQAVRAADDDRQRAQRAVDGSGGADLANLNELAEVYRAELGRRQRNRAEFGEFATQLDVTLPDSAVGEVEFRDRLATIADQLAAGAGQRKERAYELADARSVARKQATDLAAQLAALRTHRSNLDGRLLAVRAELSDVLQVPEARLPFVGELIQVRRDQAEWAGAIERVLGSFARTLVVPEPFYLATAEFVDSRQLGTRLVYERVAESVAGDETVELGNDSLVDKLELADSQFRDWLNDRLRSRFDYACVADPRDFANHKRAVTRNGQVKHSAVLHEKDDRRRVDDRSRWVLGFTTEAKEAELSRLLTAAEADTQRAAAASDAFEEQLQRVRDQQAAAERLRQLSWPEIDIDQIEAELRRNAEAIAELRQVHHDLPAMEAALKKAQQALDVAEENRRELVLKRDQTSAEVVKLEQRIMQLQALLAEAAEIPAEVAQQLGDLADGFSAVPHRLEIALGNELAKRRENSVRERSRLEAAISRLQDAYRRDWAAQASDWGIEVEFLPEYLQRLSELEDDRLPEFEGRFFNLLQDQARNNVSQLSSRIKGARREIRTRVDEVNKSLRLTEFAPASWLQIEVRDRALPEVEDFLATLNEIMSGALADIQVAENPAERQQAEQRFLLMRDLLRRLGSSDPADQAWRNKCLDTRQHVRFQAQVVDAERRQLDVFEGAGGRSGGERQKLVTFCLAAALRFQLAPDGQSVPSYALVVIDEAFDKADHKFTQAGLGVFTQFGFQLMLATPLKMLQAIEDYVGGVVMVSNASGQGSQLHELPFETEPDDSVHVDDDDSSQETLL